MAQTTQQQSPYFPAGLGVIRWKFSRDATGIYFGRITLPEVGECWIDGTAKKGATTMKLTLKRASDRVAVATLTLPRGMDAQRTGEVKIGRKTWRLIATVKHNDDGQPRMSLRLPEVKTAGAYA